MKRLRFFSFLLMLLSFSALSTHAIGDLCPSDNPENEIDSGELIENELDEGEAVWYFFDPEFIGEVWRFDVETEEALSLSLYNPDDIENSVDETGYFLNVADEVIHTAIGALYEDIYCIEIANESTGSLDYELTVSPLEYEDGRLQNTEGLDAYGNNVVGVYYHNIGEFEVALEYYALAIEEYPEEPRFWNNTCLTMKILKTYGDALEYCLEAVELAPDNAGYHYDAGVIYQALGDYSEAEGYFEDAAELDPSDLSTFFALGMNHVFLGNPDEAVDAFDEYAEISEFWHTPYWHGLAYLNAGEYEDAIEDIETAIDADEVEPALYYVWLGIAHLANGDEEAAEEAIADAEARFEDEEEDLTFIRSMAFYSVFLGENDAAQAYYDEALSLGDVFNNRGDLFYVTVLSNTFPDEEGYSEMLSWLREELGID